jgi:CelD/BcsL family acetyltransferase involved in cellulose biosynthesis
MAFALGYQYDGVWYFMETGYAQRWSHFSPGAVLFHLFVEDFYRAARPSMLDFLAGNQDYKQSFGNAQTEVSSIYLVPWNRWRLILACQSALYALERWARSIVVTLKLDRPLRKILARAGAHVSRNTQ